GIRDRNVTGVQTCALPICWITIYPKRGALVRGLGQRAVAELAEMRVLLETAGERRTPAQLRAEVAARLEDLLAAERRAYAERDQIGRASCRERTQSSVREV